MYTAILTILISSICRGIRAPGKRCSKQNFLCQCLHQPPDDVLGESDKDSGNEDPSEFSYLCSGQLLAGAIV